MFTIFLDKCCVVFLKLSNRAPRIFSRFRQVIHLYENGDVGLLPTVKALLQTFYHEVLRYFIYVLRYEWRMYGLDSFQFARKFIPTAEPQIVARWLTVFIYIKNAIIWFLFVVPFTNTHAFVIAVMFGAYIAFLVYTKEGLL
jgi:hypothetical protein